MEVLHYRILIYEYMADTRQYLDSSQIDMQEISSYDIASVAQLVEHKACYLEDSGSIPLRHYAVARIF